MEPKRLAAAVKLLSIGFVVLLVGELLLIIMVFGMTRTTSPGAQASGVFAKSAPNATSSAPVPAPAFALSGFSGAITAVGSDSIDVKPAASGGPTGVQHILLDSSTQFVKAGALKSQAQQQADLQQFHQYSDQLMQDPTKNKVALEHLIAPSPYQETPVSLSQLAVGDQVLVFFDQSANTLTAYQVIVLPPGQ